MPLEERIPNIAIPEKFGEVLVPTEQVVELVKGKRKESSRGSFIPGIYLVICSLTMKPGTL
jgi:transcriptional antiterminator NusG